MIEDICGKMTEYLKVESDKKSVDGIDCKELSAKYTTDVVSSCIFDTEAKSFTDSEAIIRKMGRDMMITSWKTSLYFLVKFMFPSIKKYWKMPLIKKEVETFFIDIMNKAISFREKNKVDRSDYLSFLMQLKEKKNTSPLDLAAHGVTFFADGFQTSSMVIS